MQPRPTAQAIDPEPVAPVEPALSDCCTTGCTPCIFDLYQDALERHEERHAAWRARQSGDAGSTPPGTQTGIAPPKDEGAPQAPSPKAPDDSGPTR